MSVSDYWFSSSSIDPAIMDAIKKTRRLTIELESEDQTARLGGMIAELVAPGVVIGLVGPLGAGKTRLARAVAESLGVDPAAISSPTFVLIHEYQGRLPIYHFDAYRLPGPQAFEDLGVTDYWDGAGVCLVEWADRVRGLLPDDCWMITLDPAGPMARVVQIELPASAALVADRLAEKLDRAGWHEPL
jgi:tRNA threonylcarbamoyladenosine biosynthesis protein TsaE